MAKSFFIDGSYDYHVEILRSVRAALGPSGESSWWFHRNRKTGVLQLTINESLIKDAKALTLVFLRK